MRGFLQADKIEVTNIPKAKLDLQGSGSSLDASSTVYATVTAGEEVHTTQAKPDAGSIVFSDSFTFSTLDVEPSEEIAFAVYRKTALSDVQIGSTTVKFGDLWSGAVKSQATQPLLAPTSGSAGYIKYDLSWTESPPPEETLSRDFIDSGVTSLSGPRPQLLRVEFYYSTFKNVYGSVSRFPIVSVFTPIFENVVEGVLSKTPLKASPEDGVDSNKTVDSIDKRIEALLTDVDTIVDQKKDEALKGLRGLKDSIKGIKPKDKSIVEATVEGVGQGVHDAQAAIQATLSDAVNNIQNFIGGLFGKTPAETHEATSAVVDNVTATTHKAVDATNETLSSVTSSVRAHTSETVSKTATSAVNSVTSTAAGAVHSVREAVGGAAESVKATAGSAVESAKSTAASATAAAKSRAGSLQGKAVDTANSAAAAAKEQGLPVATPVTGTN